MFQAVHSKECSVSLVRLNSHFESNDALSAKQMDDATKIFDALSKPSKLFFSDAVVL